MKFKKIILSGIDYAFIEIVSNGDNINAYYFK